MLKPSERFQFPESVQRLILSKKCVLFVGSGFSNGIYDSWPELINRLCRECGCDIQLSQGSAADILLDVADQAKQLNEVRYYEVLGEHFGRPARDIPLIYDVLFELPFESYLTPNLDPMLSLKARTAPRKPDVHGYPSLDRKRMTGNINYLHGMIPEGVIPRSGTIVLSRGEFEEAYAHDTNLMNFLIPALEHDHIIFIGCRLREPVMEKVFSICKAHQQKRQEVIMRMGGAKGIPPFRYILLPERLITPDLPDEHIAQDEIYKTDDEYYKTLDIEVIRYPAAGEDHSALRNAFDSVAKLPSLVPRHAWNAGDFHEN